MAFSGLSIKGRKNIGRPLGDMGRDFLMQFRGIGLNARIWIKLLVTGLHLKFHIHPRLVA